MTEQQTQPETQPSSVQIGGGQVELTETERQFLDKALPTSENKQTNTAHDDQAEVVEQSSDQQQEQRDAQRPKGWDKAVKALKLDGWSDEDLASMDPGRVVAMGRKAKERHSEIGKKLQSKDREAPAEQDESDEEEGEGGDSPKRDSKGRFTPGQGSDESEQDSGEEAQGDEAEDEDRGSAEPQRQPVDAQRIRDLVKPLSDAIGLGDEVGDELAKVLEQAIKPLQEELSGYRQYHERLVWERGEELGAKAREKLTGQFPGLSDDDKFQAVVQRMHELANTKQYQDMESLMLDAAKIELFDDVRQGSARNSLSSKRASGQPVTTSRNLPTKAMSSEDREDMALDAIFKGLGRDAAKRAYDGQ